MPKRQKKSGHKKRQGKAKEKHNGSEHSTNHLSSKLYPILSEKKHTSQGNSKKAYSNKRMPNMQQKPRHCAVYITIPLPHIYF